MPVKIRLTRRGRKQMAMYDIIVADSRSPRDGKFIEKLGTFNPNTNPAAVELNIDKTFKWIMNGAQPTDTARHILSQKGIMLKKHLQVGVNKGAITQEAADKRFEDWQNEKESAVTKKISDLAGKKDASKQERLAAETKVNAAREDALKAKSAAALAAAAAAEAPAAETTDATEPAAETTDAETPSAEAETTAQ